MCALRSGAKMSTRRGYAWLLLLTNAMRAQFLADWLTEATYVYAGLYAL